MLKQLFSSHFLKFTSIFFFKGQAVNISEGKTFVWQKYVQEFEENVIYFSNTIYILLNDIFFLHIEEEQSSIIPSCIASEKTTKA